MIVLYPGQAKTKAIISSMSKRCSAYIPIWSVYIKRFPSHFFFQYFIYEFFIKYSHNSVYYFISQHCIVLLVIVMFQQHKVFPWWFTANYWGILANSKCCLHDAMPDFYPFVFRNTGPSELGGSPPTPPLIFC